jgi:hypothetical protein
MPASFLHGVEVIAKGWKSLKSNKVAGAQRKGSSAAVRCKATSREETIQWRQ